MADTFSTNLNLTKPEVGSSTDTWGTKLNTQVIDPIDAIFSATGTAVHMRFQSANFPDNAQAIFGNGDDLSIYHDGANSYIADNGTGDLLIKTNGTGIKLQKNNGENMIKALTDGAVLLYYDNQDKLETTSNGISVTGRGTFTASDYQIEASNGTDQPWFLRAKSGGNLAIHKNGTGDVVEITSSGIPYSSLTGTPTIPTVPTNNNQLSNGAGYTTYTSNQATNTTSNPSFNGVNINSGYDLTLNTGNWTGEKSGKIQRHGSSMYFQTDNAGSFIFRNSGGGEGLYITASNGALVSSNNITAYSDIRLKKDVKTIENALDKVCAMRGVEYTRKSNDEREIGVIAQEVKEVVPELVEIKENTDSFNEGISDIHTMKYQNTVGLLIEAIKELKAELKELRGV